MSHEKKRRHTAEEEETRDPMTGEGSSESEDRKTFPGDRDSGMSKEDDSSSQDVERPTPSTPRNRKRK